MSSEQAPSVFLPPVKIPVVSSRFAEKIRLDSCYFSETR